MIRRTEPTPFENDINLDLLYWVLVNKKFYHGCQMPDRVFDCTAPGVIHVNMNAMRNDYRDKFIIPDPHAYFNDLLNKVSPTIFKVMTKHGMTDHRFSYHIGLVFATHIKNVKYSCVANIAK